MTVSGPVPDGGYGGQPEGVHLAGLHTCLPALEDNSLQSPPGTNGSSFTVQQVGRGGEVIY